jgi:hypothetical protein
MGAELAVLGLKTLPGTGHGRPPLLSPQALAPGWPLRPQPLCAGSRLGTWDTVSPDVWSWAAEVVGTIEATPVPMAQHTGGGQNSEIAALVVENQQTRGHMAPTGAFSGRKILTSYKKNCRCTYSLTTTHNSRTRLPQTRMGNVPYSKMQCRPLEPI